MQSLFHLFFGRDFFYFIAVRLFILENFKKSIFLHSVLFKARNARISFVKCEEIASGPLGAQNLDLEKGAEEI